MGALLDVVAARDSTLWAGSAAAVVGAIAAAIVAKAARVEDAAAAVQARTLAARLAGLAARDAEVLGRALTALREARERVDAGNTSDAADFLLGRTLEEAAIVPLGIAEAAADVATLAAEIARTGRPGPAEDAVAAGLLAAGAANAAAHLVSINLASQPDSPLASRAVAAAAAATESAESSADARR